MLAWQALLLLTPVWVDRTALEQQGNGTGAHSTSALKAAAMVRRSTDTNGAVYWISALLRTCAGSHQSSDSPQSTACLRPRRNTGQPTCDTITHFYIN